MKYLTLAMLFTCACATSPEQRQAERALLQRCATIELYPEGVQPQRAYRVIGPVSVSSDGNPSHRDRTLQDQACAINADAVIDVRDEHAAPSETPHGWDPLQDASVTSSGTAVAFVVEPPPPQPATP
jgi:hypothetical protein